MSISIEKNMKILLVICKVKNVPALHSHGITSAYEKNTNNAMGARNILKIDV